MQRYGGRDEWRRDQEMYGRPDDERFHEGGREDERRGDRDRRWGRDDEWRIREMHEPGWDRGERAWARGEGMGGYGQQRGGYERGGYERGGHGREERMGIRRLRGEGPPPWMQPGPDARSAGNSRGLYEWEDQGPLTWLGDKVGGSRRKAKGPKGYKRSDDRVHEEVCERLARSGVDLSEVEVKVANGEVTLTGTVDHRHDKWRLEELADDVFGVDDVHNNLRVSRREPERGLGDGRPAEPPLRH